MNIQNFVLFLHVIFVATWFGGISMMAMYLRDAVRSGDSDKISYTLNRAQRWNMTMFVPTSVLVLLTGMYLFMQFSGRPLYLLVKERFGSLFILLFIIFVTWYGRKLLKQVTESKDKALSIKLTKRYIMLLNISILCIAIIFFFVMMKFA